MKIQTKTIGLVLLALTAAIIVPALVMAETPVERGKALFNDPGFAGASRACSSCHVDGRGLEGAAKKESFRDGLTLKGMVNYCIKNASGGTPIAEDSQDMKDIVEYIKSLALVNIGVRG